jgi:hypothetical protein
MTSHKLFPSATLLVPESELEQYAHIHLTKATVPDSVMGISSLRNWLLKHFKEDAIIMLDDDISACVCMVSLRCRKLSVEETLQMLSNSAYNARGAGARLFGWHQRSDPRLLQRNDPFGVNHWVGGAVGVVRDTNGGVPVWDELLKCKCDIDASLQELLDNRLVWNEPPLFVVVRNVLIVCMFVHARRKTFSMGMHRSETFCHAFVMHPHTHSAQSSSACASTVFTASSCKSGG